MERRSWRASPPGKGGATVEGVPVFDSVLDAVEKEAAEVSIIFIPATLARDSILEAIDAGIKLVIYLGENMPVHDMMVIKRKLREKSCRMIGPNTPGIISPGEAKIGFMPYFCYQKGPVGVVSRSGSLSYEVVLRSHQGGRRAINRHRDRWRSRQGDGFRRCAWSV